jgi:L-malate glycosyltransferase
MYSEPIRLLKFMTNYGCGGTEKQVLNLVSRMDRRQYDLQFACLQKSGDFVDTFAKLGIPITAFTIGKLYHPETLKKQIQFAKFLRAERIQIMHSYNFYSNIFAIPAARMAGVPVVLASIRDRGVYLTPAKKVLQKFVCSMADRILVNADSIHEWLLEEKYPAAKIRVIKNGIDMALYEQGNDSGKFHREFGIPAGAPIVVMLSRLDPMKGVDDFIDAAAQIAPHYPDTYFLIAGENLISRAGTVNLNAPYHQKLAKRVEGHGMQGKIIFAGHRSDVPQLLAEATLSVLPSHSEGLSNTLLESMAAGLPVVATRVGGNPELVKHGVTGLLVPPREPALLAEAVMQLLKDKNLARTMGEQARQIALREFSMTRMVQLTQEMYLSQLSVYAGVQSL